MTRFILITKGIMFLCIAFAFFYTPFIINHQLTSFHQDAIIQVSALRTDTVKLIDTRANSLQEFATRLFDKTNKRVGSIQADTFKRIDNLIPVVNNSNQILNDQLTLFNKNLNNQETTLNTNIATLTAVYSVVPTQVASRFNMQTDCMVNELCWQNLTTDLLTNLRYTARDVSDASKTFNTGFPALMKDSNQIASNFDAITGNFKKLTNPRWYDRIIGYGMNAAVIYRNLNPVTSVAITGAQLISSRP